MEVSPHRRSVCCLWIRSDVAGSRVWHRHNETMRTQVISRTERSPTVPVMYIPPHSQVNLDTDKWSLMVARNFEQTMRAPAYGHKHAGQRSPHRVLSWLWYVMPTLRAKRHESQHNYLR